MSTRTVGAIIMAHGDDKGLVLPPQLAPHQVVVIPIAKTDAEKTAVSSVLDELTRSLDNIRVKIDDRDQFGLGWKFTEWETKGVPVRVELGPRDLSSKQAVVVRRDTGEKNSVPLSSLSNYIKELLNNIQKDMFTRAKLYRKDHSLEIKDRDSFVENTRKKGGFIHSFWCGDPACETLIKEETQNTIRCIPINKKQSPLLKCIYTNNDAKHEVIFAKAY